MKTKTWTWEEIAAAWKSFKSEIHRWDSPMCSMRIYLDRIPPEWRPGIALALALEKWKPGERGRGHGNCALCVLYRMMNPSRAIGDDSHCGKCPLAAKDTKCTDPGSLFMKYHRAVSGSEGLSGKAAVKLADKIYNLLVECYREEYEK